MQISCAPQVLRRACSESRSAVAAMLLCMTAMCASAASVTVTMNSTSTTMSLKDKATGTAVEVGDPTNKVYTFDAAAGTYVLTAYGTDGTTENGTIELTVADDATNEFKVLTCTTYATNSGWTLGTDYTLDVKVAAKTGSYEVINVGNSTTSGRATFLAMSGDSYFVDFVPSDAKKEAGFTTGYKNGTLTSGINVTLAIPTALSYSVTIPTDANFFMGRKISHYMPFTEIAPEKTETSGDSKVITYTLANAQVYNFRTWKDGGLTQGGYFTASTTASKMPTLNFTEDSYTAASPSIIKRDNLSQTGDILLNINERGQLKMKTGETYQACALRTWQATDNSTNNYYIEPNFHYTVTDVNGNADNSVIELSTYNTTTTPWLNITAKQKGTAIVTVTYDAMNLQYYNNSVTATNYMNGPLFGAIWPENTGVYVVTVDDADNSIEPNMTINTSKDNSVKNAGQNVDAELDVFYYASTEEGAKYTFTPTGVSTVEIAYPTIGAQKATYSGFGNTGVTDNGDGSYTLLLKNGRNIVRLTDASSNAVYQVLTAKSVAATITNVTTGDNTAFAPGDKVQLQFATLYHPANKLSGIYNMSATAMYGDYAGSANQYAFASTAAAQTISLNIPASTSDDTFTLNGGCIKVSGYGDPYGNHREISEAIGRNPNFTAVMRTAYFGQLPEISFPITVESIIASVTTNASNPTIVMKRSDGSVVTPEADGTYKLNYYGAYSYTATAEGYGTMYGSFDVESGNTYALNITIPTVDGNTWDGSSKTEPAQVDGVYQIKTGAELAWLTDNVSASAVLCNDIELCGFEWTPIGTSSSAYTGTFDGHGYTVKNLAITKATANYQGLFGYTQSTTIKNVTVEGYIDCASQVKYVGGIVGYARQGTISGCTNRAYVSDYQYVGGIVGYGYSNFTVDRCVNEGNINATYLSSTNAYGGVNIGSGYAGGIAGYAAASTAVVKNCYNTGSVSGANWLGGIVGYMNTSTTITNVYNTGDINTTATYVGAIRPQSGAATSTKNVTNAYATTGYFNEMNTTIITKAQLSSGEVAYKLGDAFGQEIGVDAMPVIGGMKVYYDESLAQYTNENVDTRGYDFAILTFEDKDYKGGTNFAGGSNWSSLIDSPQYGGTMLYGDSGMGVDTESAAYNWTDANNTWLHNILSEGYGTWCYWSGGHAISNYGSGEQSTYGAYDSQLTVFHKDVTGLTQTGNGHNGSNNFAVHYGYSDNSGFSLTEDALPALTFSDGKARVIDHMYVNNTTYAMNCYVSGNGLTPKVSDTDWVKIVATGYNGTTKGNSAEIYLCNGPKNIVMDWTKFDLSALGEVTKVTFNVTGSSDNGYGFSQPAYFAYDDVAVRMPKETDRETEEGKYGTICLPYAFTANNATLYSASINGDVVELTEVGTPVAGTPYIYKATADDPSFTYAGGASVDAPVKALPLVGIFTATEVPVGDYVMQTLEGGQKFYIVEADNQPTLSANKAYLTTGSDAKSYSIGFSADDEPTAVDAVNAIISNNAKIYDINGRQLPALQKGINIVNGVKVLVK